MWIMKLLLVLVLLSATALELAAQFTLKVGVDLVNVLFTVTDRRGRLVGNLGPEDFAVEEDGRKQTILHFARENELPLTLGMLIDTSPSVRPVFEEEKLTAVQFLRTVLKPADLAMVIGFDRTVTLVQDYTDSAGMLEEAIESLELGGGTSVYDAVYLASKEKLQNEAGRKAIILISDGADTTSKVREFEALVAVHQSNAVVYSISNAGRGFFSGRRGIGGDPETLRKFAEETGGAMFFVENRNGFRKIFDQIAMELRSQYSLGYVSTNSAKDGKYRKIKIVPRDPGFKIQARQGYYAARTSEKP
jgi:VWFA-related protein